VLAGLLGCHTRWNGRPSRPEYISRELRGEGTFSRLWAAVIVSLNSVGDKSSAAGNLRSDHVIITPKSVIHDVF
jgi:hypothetical protein